MGAGSVSGPRSCGFFFVTLNLKIKKGQPPPARGIARRAGALRGKGTLEGPNGACAWTHQPC